MAEAAQLQPVADAQEKEQTAASRTFQLNSEGSISLDPVSTEQFVGNLCAHVSLPTDHVAQVCKGNLIFDACFEGGNLGRVDYINGSEYDLFIRPDTCNPRFRVWFNFTVSNVEINQRVIFNVVNFSKTKSLYRAGMTPLVRSTSRPDWCRLPSGNVFYYRSPEHHRRYVLSFSFAFDREDDIYQFSYSYTYSYSQCQQYLSTMESNHFPWFTRQLLCRTVQQRRLDLLTITSPKNIDEKGNVKPQSRIVFITARVHPGESPASLVCQGIIDFLCGENSEAELLRDNIVFKIVPMLNPDGVYLGNYRCSLMGFDLNRHWQDPSPWAHPTLHATKQLIMEYDKDPNVDLDFYIDIHAHSTLSNVFLYGNVYDSDKLFDRHMVFPRLLSMTMKEFSWGNTSFNKDSIKAGTGRRILGSCLGSHTNCYTLEVSLFGSSNGIVHFPYIEDDYMFIGRTFVKTFLDYYRIQTPNNSSNDTTN